MNYYDGYEHVYVVTYWDNGEEPVLTAFNNEDVAGDCFKYFRKQHDGCCFDTLPIYSKFRAKE